MIKRKNAVEAFVFEGVEVKIRFENGEPWWKAKDVCELLGLKWNGETSISFVPNHLKGVLSDNTPGGKQSVLYLNEPGLYFYLSKTKSPKALPFQLWIAEKVIPSIRKTGSYSLPNKELSKLQILEMAIESEKARLALESKVEQQQLQLTVQKPKVETYDRLLNSEGLLDWCKVAKTIGTGRNKLLEFLRNKKILMDNSRRNVPYQKFIDEGYFVTKTIIITIKKEDDEQKNKEKTSIQTFATAKGLVFVEKLWYDN